MKTMFRSGVVAVLWCLPAAPLSLAQVGTPEYDPLGKFATDVLPRQVRVVAEFIEVSHEQFTELMFGEKPAANDTELRKHVAQLVKDGKANIVETMMCLARSGQKATAESIEEFIYPTEYEPASLPCDIHFKTKEDEEQARSARRNFATGPTPTAFETRNLGSTLEIEATVGESDEIIDLRLVPEIVYHVGNTVWAEWEDERGSAPVQMPTIYNLRLNTSVTLAAGQPTLMGALSPKDEKGHPDFKRKLMVFVRADVVVTGR